MIDRMSLIEQRDVLIKKWLHEAADELQKSVEADITIDTKSSRTDFVTNMDREIEKKLVAKIKEHFPHDKVISEEGYGDDVKQVALEKDTVWFLDPIDGTMNFVLQNENYAIMLAVYEKGIALQSYIYDVNNDRLYWAIKDKGVYCNDQLLPRMKNISLKDGLFASNTKFLSDKQIKLNTDILKRSMGIRTNGSAGLEAVELVKGNTVAYITYGLSPWDIAPGLMMVEENGGMVIRFDGQPVNLLEKGPTIMGTPAAIAEIRELL